MAKKKAKTTTERVRAYRVRKKKLAGAATPADAAALATYEAETERITEVIEAPAPAAAQTVEPDVGRVDPQASTWIPTTPPTSAASPEDAPPEGEEPPPEGTPAVDLPPVAAPIGDPAAAAQFAAFVVGITMIGMQSGRELLAARDDIPPSVAAVVSSEDLQRGVLETVHAAATAVAVKYGFRSVPAPPELVVGVSLVGSLVLVIKNHQRKLADKSPKVKPTAEQPRVVDVPPIAKEQRSDLDRLWDPK